MKTLALSELRLVAERFQLTKRKLPDGKYVQVQERVPWKVWYVSASSGDVIRGEECVTLAVYAGQGPGAFPSRLVMFTASNQTRRLRDCCILQANDWMLKV